MIELIAREIPDEVPKTGTVQMLARLQVRGGNGARAPLVASLLNKCLSPAPQSHQPHACTSPPPPHRALCITWCSCSPLTPPPSQGTVHHMVQLLTAVSLTIAHGFLGRCLDVAWALGKIGVPVSCLWKHTMKSYTLPWLPNPCHNPPVHLPLPFFSLALLLSLPGGQYNRAVQQHGRRCDGR